MLRTSIDAQRLNAIANHAEVRPYMGDDGAEGVLNFGHFLQTEGCFAYESEHVAFLFEPHPAGYELHVMATPEGRGEAFTDVLPELVIHMLIREWSLIVAFCPAANPAVELTARRMGFEPFARGEHPRRPGLAGHTMILTREKAKCLLS